VVKKHRLSGELKRRREKERRALGKKGGGFGGGLVGLGGVGGDVAQGFVITGDIGREGKAIGTLSSPLEGIPTRGARGSSFRRVHAALRLILKDHG